MKHRLFDQLLASLNQGIELHTPQQPPDISALKRAMAGEYELSKDRPTDSAHAALWDVISSNNSFLSDNGNPVGSCTPHDLDITHPQNSENFSEKNSGYDYRKADPPLYTKNFTEFDEARILGRLNELLAENELRGLDEAEAKEMQNLYKKLR